MQVAKERVIPTARGEEPDVSEIAVSRTPRVDTLMNGMAESSVHPLGTL